MESTPRSSLEDDFGFGESDFGWVCERAQAWAGLALTDAKRSLVHNRLVRRLRHLGLGSFSEYRRVVETDHQERQAFINALTTHVTAFFREAHHFDMLARLAAGTDDGLTIWSSACSSGEEPYTIAATLAEHMSSAGLSRSHILASDIDTDVIQTGILGVYRHADVAAIPVPYRRLFERGEGKNSGMARAKSTLRDLVNFRQLNLFDAWPRGLRDLDAIFCRNALIYFDRESQDTLIRRFVDALKPGGLLFLGHSESPGTAETRLRPVGRTAYARTDS